MNKDIQLEPIDLEHNSNATTSESNTTKRFEAMKNRYLAYALFFTQFLISISTLCFCFITLSVRWDMDANEKTVYFSILTGLIGYWLPSPKIPSNSNLKS